MTQREGEWDERWPDTETWDEFTELVSTMADEVIPIRVPVSDAFTRVVLWLLRDPEMRVLLQVLLAAPLPVTKEANP